MKKCGANVAVLGSTGSIGRQSLEVIRSLGKNYRVVSLAAHSNYRLLLKQAEEFKPECVCVTSHHAYNIAKNKIKNVKILPSDELDSIAQAKETDILLAGSAGSRALTAIYAALKKGKTVALANKEPIVMAGDILKKTAEKYGGRIIPVDSEHSALFQLLENSSVRPEKIYITSSGGSMFKKKTKNITPEFILAHPVWKMGKKITVDSSTGMNKGMEVIEAHHLFGFPFARIKVLLHPQALVHGMIEFADGSVFAYISQPDMKIPINYALARPVKPALKNFMNFSKTNISFKEFPAAKFPCFSLAVEAGKTGGIYPSVLCGANETAVNAFLVRKIPFGRIPVLIEKTLGKTPKMNYNIKNALEAEKWAAQYAGGLI